MKRTMARHQKYTQPTRMRTGKSQENDALYRNLSSAIECNCWVHPQNCRFLDALLMALRVASSVEYKSNFVAKIESKTMHNAKNISSDTTNGESLQNTPHQSDTMSIAIQVAHSIQPRKILHVHHRGDDVRQLQILLNQYLRASNSGSTSDGKKLHIEVDGIFGQATYDAVWQFQQQHELPTDGVVGVATRAALQAVVCYINRTTTQNKK